MKKVLFLCIKNSSRSQMAEAILNSKAGDRFVAYSAGSRPANKVNPYAVKVMEEFDCDLSSKVPKSSDLYNDEKFDFIITLCDKMKEECPYFSGDPIVAHWSIIEPNEQKNSEEDMIKEFRKVRNQIFKRIELLINLPMDKLDRLSIESKTKEIGSIK